MTGKTLGEPYGLTNDRADFRAAALDWAKKVRVPWGRESADAEIYRMRDIAQKWAATDQIRDLLEPLLQDPQRPVRASAAKHLWEHGVDDAEPELNRLAASGDDPAAKAAGTALRLRQRSP